MKKKVLMPVAVLAILIGGFLHNNMGDVKDKNDTVRNTEAQASIVEAPEQLLQGKSEGLAPNKFIHALVTKTVDGDTLNIEYKGKEYKVRLLDIDTPESVKQGVAVQPYSKEASEFLKKTVLGKEVKLVFEKGLRDRYGRLLAHIIADGTKHINSMLVRNGYARVEIVSPNRTFSQYFYGLQETAIREKRGLWALPVEEQPFVKNEKGMYVARYQVRKKAS